ncbi:MAG: hypothetical protein ACJAYZ_001622 [Bacteroidia bacterium]|jgi:hypothetical protein
MKISIFSICILLVSIAACNTHEYKEQKGISVDQTTENEETDDLENNQQFKDLVTRPGKALLTWHKEHQLVSIFKLNYSPKADEYFTGSNDYRYRYYYTEERGSYQSNYLPGLEVTYGYNILNVAHYNRSTNTRNEFFDKPVLVNNIYYPSTTRDSINKIPVIRDYYMASVYDEDTNGDSLINHKDLRRFYRFDMEGENKTLLVPSNYSVLGSEYDDQNDHLHVRAKLDKNGNGLMDEKEAIHIFWIDLKKPEPGVRLY